MEDNIVYLSEKTATSQEGKQQGKERTITGVVSDDMGPLIGVNVLVKVPAMVVLQTWTVTLR